MKPCRAGWKRNVIILDMVGYKPLAHTIITGGALMAKTRSKRKKKPICASDDKHKEQWNDKCNNVKQSKS